MSPEAAGRGWRRLTLAALTTLAVAVSAPAAAAAELIALVGHGFTPGDALHRQLHHALASRLERLPPGTTVRVIAVGRASEDEADDGDGEAEDDQPAPSRSATDEQAAGTIAGFQLARRPAIAASQRLSLQRGLRRWASRHAGEWTLSSERLATELLAHATPQSRILVLAPLGRLEPPQAPTEGASPTGRHEGAVLDWAPVFPLPDDADVATRTQAGTRRTGWRRWCALHGIGWNAVSTAAAYGTEDGGGGDAGRAK